MEKRHKMNGKEGSLNGTGDLTKYERHFCKNGDNKGKPHERGEWKTEEDHSWYKVKATYCKFCGEKLKVEVFK
jgi:hypothetical protein